MKKLLALLLCLILCLSLFACNKAEEPMETQKPTETEIQEIEHELQDTSTDNMENEEDEYKLIKESEHTFMVQDGENYRLIFPDKKLTKIKITKYWPTTVVDTGRAVSDTFEINKTQTIENIVSYFEGLTFTEPIAAITHYSRANVKFCFSDNTYLHLIICYNGCIYVSKTTRGNSFVQVDYMALNPDGTSQYEGVYDGLAEILWDLETQVEETYLPEETVATTSYTLRPVS